MVLTPKKLAHINRKNKLSSITGNVFLFLLFLGNLSIDANCRIGD